MTTPAEPPPSYEQATGISGPDSLPQLSRNGIPLHARRSMEDELRPLPKGWVREFDPETQHQFFVDTNSDPPRSIWHHPYDDETYLDSLPAPERECIRATHSVHGTAMRRPSQADLVAEPTDDETDSASASGSEHHAGNNKAEARNKKKEDRRSLGRRLKDRLTGTTHEQRAADRARRAAAERQLYMQHRQLRRAMHEAMRTGRPALLGRDADRVHVYLEPPGHTFPGVSSVRRVSPYASEVIYDGGDGDGRGGRRRLPRGPGRYLRPEGDMYGVGYGAYGCGKFAGGRWDRPPVEGYMRPVGRGFGGGLGFPLTTPILGGLMVGGLTGAMI